jgi:hypothetical protein
VLLLSPRVLLLSLRVLLLSRLSAEGFTEDPTMTAGIMT